jgi:hypothetical protein
LTVQALPSSQPAPVIGVPTHSPSLHMSLDVHGSKSSHGCAATADTDAATEIEIAMTY